MARPTWSGAISFGLVTVPVKLVTAVRRKDVSFHQLHAVDGARIQYRRFCSAEEREVPREEIVRGYELDEGQYVVVTDEELERLDPERSRTIDIERFVDLEQIDPIYYDASYYALPDGEVAEKPYDLLRRAMATAGKVAIGRVVIRVKEHLAAIRASGETLTVATMVFPDEVVPVAELERPDSRAEASDQEVQMACRLVESLGADFDPDRYHDAHREQVLELIEAKARGEEVVAGPEPERPEAVPDLMAALEASIASAGDGGAGASRARGDGVGRGSGGGGRSGGRSRSRSRA
jgi:DNA end-binding protein Ku